VAALSCLHDYERMRDEILRQRSRLLKELSRMDGIKPYPSEANFIMARISPGIRDLPEKLCRAGILVRDLRGVPGLEHHCIRITVGTREENRRLLESLRAIIGGQ
jgi:histidinol-phosphate aminotransferase